MAKTTEILRDGDNHGVITDVAIVGVDVDNGTTTITISQNVFVDVISESWKPDRDNWYKYTITLRTERKELA